jgi:hypothetical protein
MDEHLSTWMDWIWSSRCLELLCTSTQSSNLKWVSGGGINSPRHPKSRWLTSTKKPSVRWIDAMIFLASVHLVPSTSLGHWRSVDTTAPMLYTNGTSDHPVLKDSSPKLYCLHLQERRMNRCSTVGSSGVEAPILARLCLDSNEASDRPTVSSLRPSDHPVLLSSLLLLYNSSGASRNLTVRSSDGVIFILPPAQRTNYNDAMHRWYRRFIWWYLFVFFPFSFWPLKNRLSSQFGMWYFCIHGS